MMLMENDAILSAWVRQAGSLKTSQLEQKGWADLLSAELQLISDS